MNVPSPQGGWTLQTILSVLTLVTVVGGGGISLIKLGGSISSVQEYVTEAKATSEVRRQQIDALIGAVRAKTDVLDDRVDVVEANQARMIDRMAALEDRGADASKTLREVQATLAQQNASLQVILAWIEDQKRRDAVANPARR